MRKCEIGRGVEFGKIHRKLFQWWAADTFKIDNRCTLLILICTLYIKQCTACTVQTVLYLSNILEIYKQGQVQVFEYLGVCFIYKIRRGGGIHENIV